MVYRTSFQCPDSGQTVIAKYAFGLLTVVATSEDGEEIMSETAAWCNRHNGKRFASFEAANEYLLHVSDGQTLGLEEARY